MQKVPKVILGENGFIVPDEIYKVWKEAYSRVNIDNEIIKSYAWILSNPHKAPKKQYGRFLNSWLQNSVKYNQKIQKAGTNANDFSDIITGSRL